MSSWGQSFSTLIPGLTVAHETCIGHVGCVSRFPSSLVLLGVRNGWLHGRDVDLSGLRWGYLRSTSKSLEAERVKDVLVESPEQELDELRVFLELFDP